MSIRLPNVNPSDTTKWPNGLGTFNVGSLGDNSKVLFYNETPLNIDIDFYDGRTDVLHAWEARWWYINADTQEIGWQIDTDSLSVTTPPINVIFITLYGPNEQIPGVYPISLVRTVGGNVTTQQSQTLDNIGNAPNSNVINVGSTAATGSTMTLTNDGLFQLAVTIAGILKTVLQTFEPAAGGTILQEGVATYLTEQLGDLQIDGTLNPSTALNVGAAGLLATLLGSLKIVGTTEFDNQLNSGATNNFILNAVSGKQIELKNNGTTICTIDGSNVALQGAYGFQIGPSGVYRFRNGTTIQNWSSFSGTGSGTYNHNFGSAPFDVVPIVSVAGSATQGFDTITSTQVHITLGAVLAFKAFCWS